MPIRMQCRCGQEMVTQDQHVGRKVRCPGCSKLLLVPKPEQAELPVSAIAEPEELKLPDEIRVKEERVESSARLASKAAEEEMRAGPGQTEEPVEDSPLPKLEIPNDPMIPEMEPETLDDDDLFDEAEGDEEIVETEAVEAVTSGPPPLPGSEPPPMSSDDPDVEVKDAWSSQTDVKVGESKGSGEKRRPKLKPGEMSKTDRMMRVHFGLGLLLGMTFAWMLVMILNIFFSVIGGFSVRSAASARGLTIVLALIRDGGWQVTFGLGLAGCLLCCWSTARSGVKTLALIASAFLATGMFFNFIALVSILLSSSITAAVIAFACEIFASLLGLVGVILMLTFLKRLAKYLGDTGSVDEAHYLITAWPLAYYFIPILIFTFTLLLLKIGLGFLFLFIIVAFLAWLGYWVTVLLRLLNLIGTLRQMIAYRFQ